MVLFDEEGRLRRYQDVREILESFYNLRLEYYFKRKEYILSKLERDIELLMNKKRFILAVINEEINIRNVKRKLIVAELAKKGFVKMKDMPKIKSTKFALKDDPTIR